MVLVRRESPLGDQGAPRRTLPLFAAAAAREDEPAAEIEEPIIELGPMTAGSEVSEVVEDYSHVGLTLRQHPVTFPRDDLAARCIVTCTQPWTLETGVG
jgi:error-prone DNA polymerase